MRTLIAIPVFNEAATAERVLRRIHAEHADLLVIDDGSSDETPAILEHLRPELGFDLIQRQTNAGYGRGMRDAFQRAAEGGFDWLITMDCDEQHEPESIPDFLKAQAEACPTGGPHVISGSRYMHAPPPDDPKAVPPSDRRAINKMITAELNTRIAHLIGGPITDGFCGFKSYRVDAVNRLDLDADGYAFPMQFWVQAAAKGLQVTELPVRLIYNDPNRTFGGGLDDPETRLAHYREILHTELCRCSDQLPEAAAEELVVDCGGTP